MGKRSFILVVVVILFSAHSVSAMAEEAALECIKKDADTEVGQLIDKGLGLNCTFKANRTMLHEAVSHNAPKTTQLLLGRGINPNAPDDHGICPLHLVASYEDRSKIADALLACKLLIIDPQDQHGNTPLHFVVTLCNYDMIEKLIVKGADPSICDEDEEDAFAKARGVSRILGLLLSKKS